MHPERKPSQSAYWRGVFRFEAGKIAPWTGLRNAIGVVVPLAVAVLFGHTSGGLVMAIGALNTAYSDVRDLYPQRARRMSATALLCGLAVFSGGLVAQNHAAAIVLSAVFAFAAGMAVALGATAGEVGTITVVTFLVFSAEVMTPGQAALSGLLAVSGGLLQMALALAFWPVSRYQEERNTLAELYRELARAAASPAPAAEAPPASVQTTRARQVLDATAPSGSLEGERYLALLSQGERIRLTLLALARLRWRMARVESAETGQTDRALSLAASQLDLIANVLRTGGSASGAHLDQICAISEALRDGRDNDPPDQIQALSVDIRHHLDALAGQLRFAVELAAHATPGGLTTFESAEAKRPWRLRLAGVLAILRANLNWRSSNFRHAVRLAVCVTLGIAVGRALDVRRSYWIPMTVAIVLKPDFASTFSRGVLRVLGTLAGLACATALFHVMDPGPAILIILIGVFAFMLRCFGPANYGIFAAAISALVVLLFAATGIAPQMVISARAANTLAGGAIALAAYLAWPTWERTQIRQVLAIMLEAYRRYFQLVCQGYLTPSVSASRELDRGRLAGRLARSNVEASLTRLKTEPGADSISPAVTTLLANSHRFIHAVMSLEAGLSTSPEAPARAEFRLFANQVDTTLYLLAAALRGSVIPEKDLPNLREAHHALIQSGNSQIARYTLVNTEADRITNSLNTLSEQILGLVGEPILAAAGF